MRPLRILLVANTLPPHDLSGVGEQVVQLAAGLRERGHEVRLLGRGGAGARGPKALFPLTIVPALRRALRDFAPDVVQLHESDAGIAARWLKRFGRRGTLLVALLQVSYVEERRAVRPLVAGGVVLGRPGAVERRFRWTKAPLQILLGRWTARAADLVLVPSGATGEEIARDYGVRPAGVLPNVTGGQPVEAREIAGAAGETGYFLFVGRLRIRKGVEILLAALARLAATHAGARLLVAGEGEHRAELERRARELGVAERVLFLGRATAAEVRGLLARARAIVVPSIYEGMPLVILEAMEAGLPVVASAVSGIPEVVLDGETGWLVPPEDAPALAGALREALDRADEATRRGAAGRARVEACYRPRHAADAWEAVVADALEGRRS